MASKRDIAALAAAIYGEARNESRLGREAVAHVAINRAEIGGVSYSDAVYGSASARYGQFSFANPQDPNARITAQAPTRDPRRWSEAVAIATQVAQGRQRGTLADPTQGATHYHANYVSPSWARSYPKTRTIGAHKFYRAPTAETRALVRATTRSQHRRTDLTSSRAIAAIGEVAPVGQSQVASFPKPNPNAGLLARSAQYAQFEPLAYSQPSLLGQVLGVSPAAAGEMPVAAPTAAVERAPLPDLPTPPIDPASYAQMSSMPNYPGMDGPLPVPLQDQVQMSPVTLPGTPPPVPTAPPPATPMPPAQPEPRPGAPAFSEPMPSGFDVWQGQSDYGVASSGHELTRMPDGSVYRYSPQYDHTEIRKADGGFGGLIKGRVDGPVGGGIDPPSFNSMFSRPETRLGGAVRGGLGGVAGGMAGSALGPVVGLLGAALGRELATGGLLNRERTETPGFQELERQARAARNLPFAGPTTTGGAFPNAPRPPRNRGSDDFDYARARDISPRAADAVRDGRRGLF